MKKIWIECQKCGSVFWIFSDEVKSVYPKIQSITKYALGANNLKNNEMYDYFLSLKNEVGFYFTILEYTFYFIVGALSLYIINKFRLLLLFILAMFSKNKLREKFQFILKIIFFIFLSTVIGWIIIKISF